MRCGIRAIRLMTAVTASSAGSPNGRRPGAGIDRRCRRVTPRSRKLWRLRYRFGDKQNMLSLGQFPDVLLASARTKRNEARKLIAQGIDPSQQIKQEKLAAKTASNALIPMPSQRE